MCREECHYNRRFEAAVHSTIYCEDCHEWFHLACLPIVGNLATLLREDADSLPEWLRYDYDGPPDAPRAWAQLRAVPLVRNYPTLHPGKLVTVESLVREARRAVDVPSNVAAWVRRAIASSLNERREKEREIAYDMVKNLRMMVPNRRVVYKCPSGHIL